MSVDLIFSLLDISIGSFLLCLLHVVGLLVIWASLVARLLFAASGVLGSTLSLRLLWRSIGGRLLLTSGALWWSLSAGSTLW